MFNQVAHFIEKQRALSRQFKRPIPGRWRGEGAARVKQSFPARRASPQFFDHPAAIAAAQIMNSAGNQLLTGAGSPRISTVLSLCATIST